MGVARDVAVAGKMLAVAIWPFLRAADVRPHERRHAGGIFAERADVDDRILRIVLDVGDGIKLTLTDGTTFQRRQFADSYASFSSPVAPVDISSGNRVAEEPVTSALFEIVADQQWHSRAAASR